MIDKAVYQRRIWTYKKRRRGLRARCIKMTQKITMWESLLRKVERKDKKRKEILDNLVNNVNEYFNLDIKNRSHTKRYTLARNIYYTIGINLKFWGASLSRHIGRSKEKAIIGRRNLLSSLKQKPENKEAYLNFKNFFEKNKLHDNTTGYNQN